MYNINKRVEKAIYNKIVELRRKMRDEEEGFNRLIKIVKDKYTHFADEHCILVILDNLRMNNYTTILCDGTFLSGNQLYLIYTQVGPTTILLTAFAITRYKDKDTYYFIYNNLKERFNIQNVIHDHESSVVYALKDLNLTFVNDTFHLFLYINDKNIRELLYKYIKFPELRPEISKNPLIQDYLERDGIKEYGLFGSHSTSCVEGMNNTIKKKLKNKRSRSDLILEILVNIHNEQVENINNFISTSINKSNNNDTTKLHLWPECESNLNQQLLLLCSQTYKIDKINENIYTLKDNKFIYHIVVSDKIHYSCGYREFT